jgi:putative tryptophan/tyrosine transport system substrate-binding protein
MAIHIRRRELLVTLGGVAVAWPFSARAQQPAAIRRIAILDSAGREAEPRIAAFRQRLDNLGWHDRRNVQIEIRRGEGDINQARNFAAELAAMKPDIFFATNTQMVQLIQAKTGSIPIVFVNVPDPVGSGLVASFAHPGGNITGFTNFDSAMAGKWLELLKDVAPNLKRVAVILQAGNPTGPGFLKTIEAAAPTFAVQVKPASLSDGPSIDAAIEAFAQEPEGGLIVIASALTAIFRDRIIALAARTRLPAIYPYSEFTAAGGLMSYGINQAIFYQEAAVYVDRILKGEKPGDLPVQTPTKIEFVINLKVAKSLGIKVSDNLLSLADEVIE